MHKFREFKKVFKNSAGKTGQSEQGF